MPAMLDPEHEPRGRLLERAQHLKPRPEREAAAAKRREALLAQQSDARARRIEDVRRIAMEALLTSETGGNDAVEVEVEVDDDEEDESMDVCGDRKAAGEKKRRLVQLQRTLFFSKQLQMPDWPLEFPSDLAENWLAMLRPEGERCLLLSDGGQVEVRRKNGSVAERYLDTRFPKGLTILDVVAMDRPTLSAPSDGPRPMKMEKSEMAAGDEPVAVNQASDLLAEDCEMAAADGDRSASGRSGGRRGRGKGRGKGGLPKGKPKGERIYAVCDVLVWGDADLVNAEAECRMYWLESRFGELPSDPPRRARPLQLVPVRPATPDVLTELYQNDFGYAKDAFLLFHRQGAYAMQESVTPLVLWWRDRRLNRYVVDTPDPSGETLPEKQAVVLELRGAGNLRTADREIVGQLSGLALDTAKEMAQGKTRVLLRFLVSDVDVAAKRVIDPQPQARVLLRSRTWADSWGRIAFQHLHRKGTTQSISFEALLKAAS
mmetsp:Transcript_65312/g.156126  ORF Transcript_65312/g.156126 Transcript_65312/m.156126 type:complete len:489 (+) Transcript_65312:88-1554(+)|eukprot:CAMPEP_0178380504 /NCGR_PEP_ID=MMETSP0689_2-20121128/5496_1 /TAXON_ID=160604 /ORGANISM="Amphidinium massartii, Strain CS-259" /LENGTH=488 /DNA_ID=CAMNT_0020000647 /DNA_START=85 /DNA_END=1551 /DNA_ORIENTATION=-